MRDFSFRFITVAILAFVFLYIFTLKGSESLIRTQLTKVLRQAVLTDSEQILAGDASYADVVHDQVREALTNQWIRTVLATGVDINVVVRAGRDEIIYPRYREWFPLDVLGSPLENDTTAGQFARQAPYQSQDALARENYRLMSKGLNLNVKVTIRNNTWFSNGVLILYMFTLLQVLWMHAKRFVIRAEDEKLEIARRLEDESKQHVSRIESELNRVRTKLSEASRYAGERVSTIRALESEKAKLEERLGGWSWQEAGDLDKEMASLEEQLKDALAEKKKQENAAQELAEKIQKRETRQVPRSKAREAELLERRLKILYKQIDFEHRVVADLIGLGDDDALLRAEEVIKRLNDRDENLPMRRKVGGLEHGNIFELGFGGKGRIYCGQGEGGRMRIILVGAKNSQDRDLSYLRRYREPKA
jgi:hypothetical protein